MPRAMRTHQAVLRAAVEDHGGVVVKDTGDGMFAAFAAADDAVAAAVDAQRGLAGVEWGETGPLKARMGVHSGEAEPLAGDYHGPSVNRAARIMGVAHGGQIVVSAAAVARCDALPPGVSLRDLGPQRLRDLSASVRLHQALHPELPSVFPPLRSLDAVANNLPAELSSFVGRERELGELAAALHETRLLTLTGVGGVGKTRLALQLGADCSDRYSDGVWLASFAPISEAALVAPELATALRISEQPGRTWEQSIVAHLRAREALLVFDNCEHVLEAVASLSGAILAACPRARILVTSRESLNIPGETVWQVPPLSLADEDSGSEAERLFLDRARLVDPHFSLAEGESEALARICRRLDGIPLAIELAAARVRVLSIPEIAERLNERFQLLTGGSRTALPRQRTLEATVRWSYDLLDDDERRLFERLSVFAGSFTLDAVEQVCAAEPLRPEQMLDLITELADRSLVVHERSGPPSRYRLLETMRTYGLDRLADRGEVRATRDAHLAWVNSFARAAARLLDGPDQELWLDRVAEELDDIRAALAWALDNSSAEIGLACAATFYRYWYIRGVREGRTWLDRLLAAAPAAPQKILAKALYASGSLTQLCGDNEAAATSLERSLALYRAIGNERGAAWALHDLGMAEWALREPTAVKARFDEALKIFRQLGDPIGIAYTLQFLGCWELAFGDPDRSIELFAEHEALVRPTGIPNLVAHTAEFAADARWRGLGELDEARPLLREALGLYRQVGTPLCAAHGLESTAGWAAACGAAANAAVLLGATEALRADAGTPVPPYESLFYQELRELLHARLGEEAYERALAHGRTLGFDAAIDAALAVTEDPGGAGAHTTAA